LIDFAEIRASTTSIQPEKNAITDYNKTLLSKDYSLVCAGNLITLNERPLQIAFGLSG